MQTIKLQVQDELISIIGLKGVKKLLEEELVYQKFQLIESKVSWALSSTAINWEIEFEKKRKEAFEEYRKQKSRNK